MPVTNHIILRWAALSPYLMGGTAVAAVLLLFTRRWWAAGAAAILTGVVVFVELPLFLGDQVPPNSVPVRVLTANLREGKANSRALVAIARTRADILIFEELTPGLVTALVHDGLTADFPYRVTDAQPGAGGVGIWSRYPVTGSSLIAGYELGVLSADIRAPGTADDLAVLAAHLAGPWPQPIDDWRDEIARLPATMGEIAAKVGNGAVIIGGDFNATFDMAPFRRLLRNGFRDAAEQSGSGFTPSFSAESWTPPLIGIDHILTYNSAAGSVETVRIPGSDHLGLIATVYVPGR